MERMGQAKKMIFLYEEVLFLLIDPKYSCKQLCVGKLIGSLVSISKAQT